MTARAASQNAETGAIEVVDESPKKKVQFKTKKQAFLGGLSTGLIAMLILAGLVFGLYAANTNDLNHDQRVRAVCEFQGGKMVENYCISGDRVLTINLNK